tara:strand:+ start:65 stop:469 length:405 start_codon:yes stop_codon:yes gene_type:complete
MPIILILFCIGLILSLIIIFLFRKVSGILASMNSKYQLKLKSRKEIDRNQKLAAIDKAIQEAENNDKLFMERRKLKALRDTNFDLFYDEEKDLHEQRLKLKNKSKWKGVIYYSSEKGKIYSISKEGNRIYNHIN